MNPGACWVCGGATRTFLKSAAFDAVACPGCGHIQAEHHAAREPSADYHRGYEQGAFVESLRATRHRQAERILHALATVVANGKPSLFDFGCGRGWFLDSAREHGLGPLAGGDVSELALQLLAERGIQGIPLHAEEPFERLDFARLGFQPEVLSFLDVLEHFRGDLSARLNPWMKALPASVRWIVIKVPVRDGLMFALASQARKLGVGGLSQQLFQVGTFPPHYQYFTRQSLAAFVSSLGLVSRQTLDDLDFEPAELGGRLTSTLPWVRQLGSVAGHVLGGAAQLLGRADSRIVIAERQAPHQSSPDASGA